MSSGKTLNALVQVGKSGMIYILDRDNNSDGSNNAASEYSPEDCGFNAGGDQVVQEVQTPISGAKAGAQASGAQEPTGTAIYISVGPTPALSNALARIFLRRRSALDDPHEHQFRTIWLPGADAVGSSNGSADGIVWVLDSSAYVGGGPEVVYAYDARNLADLLYSSNANASRDAPGPATRSAIPTIADGKVYVPASNQFSVYGLLGTIPTTPAPVISPASGTFSGSETITVCFNTACTPVSGGTIDYTLDGSTPTAQRERL